MEEFKIRCADCPYMKKKNGVWVCEECFNQKCAEIDDCPEGVTAEQIKQIEQETKGRINVGAGKGKRKKPTKPRGKKVNPIKKEIISTIFSALCTKYDDVVVENDEKYINLTVNGAKFTINLVQHREKSAK